MEIETLYSGTTVCGKLNQKSKSFLNPIHTYIKEEFSSGDPCLLSSQIPYDVLQVSMAKIRKRIYENQKIKGFLFPILEDLNLDPEDVYVDLFRLRCVPNEFHLKEEASSVQFLHRDPWYANPQNQINLWVPITKVELGAGFAVYPSYFAKPLENNSHLFDLHHWKETGGFQAYASHPRMSEKVFPRPVGNVQDPDVFSVSGDFGEYFIFSSQHLHGTENNTQGCSRFSLEVRFVVGEHVKKCLSPRNVDNRSKGTTLSEMTQLLSGHVLPDHIIQSYANQSALS
ncbi:hypothetical protein AB3N58_12630 [Leptospira sp. WS60.C2]